MKCMNCGSEIPEAWVKAISLNSCPACGDKIYSDNIKELMDELASALERMPNNPQGLAGWLLANYKVTKIGSAEPVTEFYGQKQKQQPQDEQGLKLAHSPIQDWQKRANVKTKSPEELAELARKVNELREGSDEPSVQEEDYNDKNDPEVQAMAALMNQPVTKKQIQQYRQHQVSSEFDHADDRHPAIQAERMKRLQTQNELAGGGVGSIKRRD
jgi:hypothetical protein